MAYWLTCCHLPPCYALGSSPSNGMLAIYRVFVLLANHLSMSGGKLLLADLGVQGSYR